MNEKSLEVEVSNRQTLIKERRFILLNTIPNQKSSDFNWFWTKWWPFCPKPFCPTPLEIQTKWPPFCMAFHWFVFRMVGTISIAIAITDHSKTEPLEIRTSKRWVFQCVCIPIFSIQVPSVLERYKKDLTGTGLFISKFKLSQMLWPTKISTSKCHFLSVFMARVRLPDNRLADFY